MLDWTATPPTDSCRPGMRLVRTPKDHKLEVLSVSRDLVGLFTHFWQKRTRPCTGPLCEPCQAGAEKRWHAWLGGWLPRINELCIFEMPAQAAMKLVKYREHHGTLRAARIFAYRPSMEPNGRVVLLVDRWNKSECDLPPEFDIREALGTIWGVKLDGTPTRFELAPLHAEEEPSNGRRRHL